MNYSLRNPEQIYKKIYPNLEIPEDSLESIRSREIKGYRIKSIISGPYVESEVYPIWKKRSGVPRAPKKSASRTAQENLNEKNAIKRIVRLSNANFTERDIWATFTYDEEHLPQSMEEAQKNIQNYIRRLKRAREKAGLPELKYIYVTEYHESTVPGLGIRYHHHLILSGGFSRDDIENLWTCGGRKQARRLQPDDQGITGLAVYISKAPQNGRRRWASSKNLIQPEIRTADTKTKKTQVFKAAADFELLREFFERLYPTCKITDIAPPAFNDLNGGVYLYARMWQKVRQ